MASTPKVGAASAASAPSPVGWAAGGGFRHSFGDRVDGVAGAASIGIGSGWRPNYEDRPQGYFFFGQYPQQHEPEQPLFTALVARSASAFPATETFSEIRAQTPVFIADLLRGIEIYEFNMKVITGTLTNQGTVINRYG
jgi:hypothetical protein